ncbi:hypothetical protein [Massilia mucilaginosa]|uniref:hypothetical protein n=1 Tax=Massilia mucilaginosa TaxID=2609282 RepID=UPI00141E4618|nr:hypothetical protein [Massilia mucilaginosa]
MDKSPTDQIVTRRDIASVIGQQQLTGNHLKIRASRPLAVTIPSRRSAFAASCGDMAYGLSATGFAIFDGMRTGNVAFFGTALVLTFDLSAFIVLSSDATFDAAK